MPALMHDVKPQRQRHARACGPRFAHAAVEPLDDRTRQVETVGRSQALVAEAALAIGSGGVLVQLTPRVHALAGLQLVHISNASLKGPGRNPDIEAIGPRVGLTFTF